MSLSSRLHGRGHRFLSWGASTLAVVVTMSLPTQASAATRIKSQPSNLCLDVSRASTVAGTVMTVANCHLGANQVWEFSAIGQLKTFGGTRCLAVRQETSSTRISAVSEVCTGARPQKWIVTNNGSIKHIQSGLCLDVVNDIRSSGTPVQIAACTARSNQVWLREDGVLPDQLRPSTPSGLQTSSLTCNSVNLSWAASTDNVEISVYDVFRDGRLAASVSGAVRSSRVTLTPGATAALTVKARDAAGNVSFTSAAATAVAPACNVDTQAPTAPAGLSGTASATTAALAWRASTDNVGVAAYDVYRNGTRIGSTAGLSFTASGLASSTAYSFTVAARDAIGNASPQSLGLTLTTASPSTCASVVCSVRTAGTDTSHLWGLAVLVDGNLIYSRRDALDLVHLNPTTGVRTALGVIPNSATTGGEGGALGVAVTPNFPASDPWLYVFHTSPTDNRIVRIRYANGALDMGSVQVLLSGIPRNIHHNGGRLRFGPDGMLYASTGDALDRPLSQDLNSLAGKVLRLNPNGGAAPADNPFGNYVWSYGHRNPQGLAFDSQGRLWEQEFGEDFQDETNLIVKGGNYGWPLCEGTTSRSGTGCATAGFIEPKYTYHPSVASCSGIGIVRDTLYVGCLRGSRMYRHVISGSSLTATQELFVSTYGRIRAIEPSVDGDMWLMTNGFDRILKVDLGN